MQDDERLDTKQVLGRAVRLTCPLCGERPMYRGMHVMEHCAHCGFSFEREPGYWSNAATLNFMVTGSIATIVIAPMSLLTSWSMPVLIVAALSLAVGLALAGFRHIKALWLAADLLIRPPTTFERLSGYLHTVRVPNAVVADDLFT